jgi:hypothetical protein
MSKIVLITREAALDVIEALERAIELAVYHGWRVDQVRFEDAFKIMRDALFPTLPEP